MKLHRLVQYEGTHLIAKFPRYRVNTSRLRFQNSQRCQWLSVDSQESKAKRENHDLSITSGISKGRLGAQAKQKEEDREFFAHILSSAATKRDAKAYLSRLKNPVKTKVISTATKLVQPRVNLGDLFGRGRAIEESPIFTQYVTTEKGFEEVERLHVALVKISNIEEVSDTILLGIADTLAYLNRLSMVPCILLESAHSQENGWRQLLTQQADRFIAAFSRLSKSGARRLENIFSLSTSKEVEVSPRELLLRPLRQGQIPVIIPVAYSEDSNRLEPISTNAAMIALTRELAGLNVGQMVDIDDAEQIRSAIDTIQKQISLDRIITIDRAGGIPGFAPTGEKHVFINLEQEFDPIMAQLTTSFDKDVSQQHKSNLSILKDALQLLPPESSGFMTTHKAAANPVRIEANEFPTNVGTRRQKNALIHNLLTDRPAFSSSLPSGRLGRDGSEQSPISTSSFVKRGMPVTILPNPLTEPWTGDSPRLTLTDPRVDLGRLVHLIEDSFNRKLDVEDYLNRVNDRIAGIIVAGEYEGGALLTWETPPGEDPNDVSRLVPYLDKFAVLKRSQGAGGVADLVFNAMVRTCFPNGVCWRSRKNNPVNKWYFERSRGTWKIPDMNWTMFWTTPGVDEDSQIFHDYERVCRGVEPSWADKKQAAD